MKKAAIVANLLCIVALLVYLIGVFEPSGFLRYYLTLLIDLFYDENRMPYPLLALLLIIYPVLNLLVTRI